MDPNPVWLVSLWEEEIWTYEKIQSKNHAKVYGEIAIYKSMKGASEETNTASTLIQNLYPPELWEKAKICSLSYLVSFSGEGNGNPLQYYCLENPMDGGAWKAAVRGVAKSRIRLSNFTFTFHFHALEKEMAIHSSVLAWRIPGTGEPGGLLSMGLHRVGHDWSDLAAAEAWYTVSANKCLIKQVHTWKIT